jgi:hypothetical protein
MRSSWKPVDISDSDLRALVRDVIAQGVKTDRPQADAQPVQSDASATGLHVSHQRLTRLTSADADGFCLIEPTVRCSRCGYCLSLGH